MRWLILLLALISGCSEPWNNPYSYDPPTANTLYGSFAERPKTLDPAKSYSTNESMFVELSCEPPLDYHYLIRPYQLIPLTAAKMPEIQGHTYTITIKPNIHYHPHPAFVLKNHGYSKPELEAMGIHHIIDFPEQGSRELTAADYVYQIKRLAHPKVQSPILGLMSEYILGLEQYSQKLKKLNQEIIDLRTYDFPGVKILNKYQYQIILKDRYPQFIYWLAMPFFSPMPWEADLFNQQSGIRKQNLTLDWYPVGTGPYRLMMNNPNQKIVLEKNPNYRDDFYPTDGDPNFMADAGKKVPFIDKIIFSLEKEEIPRWTKFFQGYYDNKALTEGTFDQAINFDTTGNMTLMPEIAKKNIKLTSAIEPSVFFWGFNMQDPIVGKNKKLRQAIASCLNFQEFITIFLRGNGIAASGPLPPEIAGYEAQALVYDLGRAKRLLAQAGYPHGRDRKTGRPLILHFDTVTSGSPTDKALYAWYRKQFAAIGIELNIRATQYNRFQQKISKGQAQMFNWGWRADYPDPENFLFLFYGPNSKVLSGGENIVNYQNPEFDKLFTAMQDLSDGADRKPLIQQMLNLIRQDQPWIWSYYPKRYTFLHQWVAPYKAHSMSYRMIKYFKLDPELRAQKRRAWNQPVLWPVGLLFLLLILITLPVIWQYYNYERRTRQD